MSKKNKWCVAYTENEIRKLIDKIAREEPHISGEEAIQKILASNWKNEERLSV